MSDYRLTYFDAPVSRGEECRLALHAAGIKFEDERVTFDQWPLRKTKTPYGAVPVLAVEGKGEIAQSNAILRYVGQGHGMHPADPFEAARHDALMGAIEDMRVRMGPIMRIKDPEEKKKQREEVASGYLQDWAAAIEKQIGPGPFLAGEQLSVADLKLYVAVSGYMKGNIDHIPVTVFSAFPKLLKLAESVKAHPKVASWYAKS